MLAGLKETEWNRAKISAKEHLLAALICFTTGPMPCLMDGLLLAYFLGNEQIGLAIVVAAGGVWWSTLPYHPTRAAHCRYMYTPDSAPRSALF